jgi:hypothetical protein
MAESLGGGGVAHLHESLVGVVFRRQDRNRRLVPVHASESDDASGYLYHTVSDTITGGSCDLSPLKKRFYEPGPLAKLITDEVFRAACWMEWGSGAPIRVVEGVNRGGELGWPRPTKGSIATRYWPAPELSRHGTERAKKAKYG